MPEKHPTNKAGRRIPFFIFISLLCFYCLLLSTRFDGYERAYYATAKTAITIHEFNMGEGGMTQMYVINGKRYFVYVLQSILDIPLVAAGMFLDSVFEKAGLYPQLEFFFPKAINAILTALTAVIVYLFSLNLYKKERLSAALAFIYGLSTLAVPYAQIGMEPILTLLAFLGFYLIKRSVETGSSYKMLTAGLLFGLCMGTKTYAFFLYPFAALYLLLLHRKTPVKRLPAMAGLAVAGILIGLIPYLGYNYLMFHDLFAAKDRTKFASDIFASPGPMLVLRNIYAFFFSAGKSFFLYSPPLVLVFWGFRQFFKLARAEAWTFLLISLFWLFLFSSMDIPIYWADESWGARYFHALVPFLILTIGGVVDGLKGTFRRAGFYTLIGLGFLVQMPGSLVYYAHYTNILITSNLYTVQNSFYIPELSHIPINIFLIWASIVGRLTGTFPTYQYWPRSTIFYKVKYDPITLSIDPSDYISAWWYQVLSYDQLGGFSTLLVVILVSALFTGFIAFGLWAWRLSGRSGA